MNADILRQIAKDRVRDLHAQAKAERRARKARGR
jgi:hypothetical protein